MADGQSLRGRFYSRDFGVEDFYNISLFTADRNC